MEFKQVRTWVISSGPLLMSPLPSHATDCGFVYIPTHQYFEVESRRWYQGHLVIVVGSQYHHHQAGEHSHVPHSLVMKGKGGETLMAVVG